jgi:hypothetical protein
MRLEHDTIVGKTLQGYWQAESRHHIHGTRVLVITTSRDTDRAGRVTGISSYAKGCVVEGAFLAHMAPISKSWGDFRKTVLIEPGKRATEKSVRELHAKALANLDALMAEVHEHYEGHPVPQPA